MAGETVSTTCAWVAVAVGSLVFAGSENAPLACRRIQYFWNLCLRWAGLGGQDVVGKSGAEPESRTEDDAAVPTAGDLAKTERIGELEQARQRTLERMDKLEEAQQKTRERIGKLEEAHQRALDRVGKLEEAHQRTLDRIHGLSPQPRSRSDRRPFRPADKSFSPN